MQDGSMRLLARCWVRLGLPGHANLPLPGIGPEFASAMPGIARIESATRPWQGRCLPVQAILWVSAGYAATWAPYPGRALASRGLTGQRLECSAARQGVVEDEGCQRSNRLALQDLRADQSWVIPGVRW